MKTFNNYLDKLEVKKYDTSFLIEKIFNGHIIVFNKSKYILDIVNIIEKRFFEKFGYQLKNFLFEEYCVNESSNEKYFLELQNEIKTCEQVNEKFLSFLSGLGFDPKKIFKDQYSLRYSPPVGKKPYGKLRPAKTHRDTWGSNIFSQINFWFPLHDVSEYNSIFIVPSYFNKKIKNNSSKWSFDKFRKIKNYPSVPYTNEKINKKEKLFLSLKKGNIICFSGNHLHGSSQNDDKRINLETRIVYQDKNESISYPENIDSSSQISKKNWFVNKATNEKLD